MGKIIFRKRRVFLVVDWQTGLVEYCLKELRHGAGVLQHDKWSEAKGIRLKVKGRERRRDSWVGNKDWIDYLG